MALTTTEPARVLGRRLRELRERQFPGVTITQRALGKALGGTKPVSPPAISSWEKGSAIPAERWIAAYATIFSTRRSLEGESLRLLRNDELKPDEKAEQEALQRELLSLRANAQRVGHTTAVLDVATPLSGSWHFGDGMPIRIVCGQIPLEQQNREATPTHPTMAYGELYTFSNIDALFELHGHIRAANPRSEVQVLKAHEVEPDDLASHLVILGGIDLNPLARRSPELLPSFPVRQVSDASDPRHAYFEVSSDGEPIKYGVELSGDELTWDVGLFVRSPNPFNRKRTLTICNAMYSVGTWAVVRTLTDTRFRDRNEEYLNERFPGQDMFSILMRILVLNGYEAVTPDWTVAEKRLYEWPERAP
jgi:hypothetical protein